MVVNTTKHQKVSASPVHCLLTLSLFERTNRQSLKGIRKEYSTPYIEFVESCHTPGAMVTELHTELWSDWLILFSDREPCPVHVLHSCEGAVRRRAAEAGGASSALVQHGHDARAARDSGVRQGGDPQTGGSSSTPAKHKYTVIKFSEND